MSKKVNTADLMRLCFNDSTEYINMVLSQKRGVIVSLTNQSGKKCIVTTLLIDFDDNSRLRIVKSLDKHGKSKIKVTS